MFNVTENPENKGKWIESRIQQSVEEIANARSLIGVTGGRRGSGVDNIGRSQTVIM
jgi:hypothetical protein